MPTPSAPNERRFVTIVEAAKRWNVSVDTIRRLISAGRLTGYRLNGRIIRVSVADVDACFKPIPTARSSA